jgi:spermidine synthase
MWLLLLAAGSGVAALIYEVVWFPLLQLTIGSTTDSLGWLLAAFMGGMCAGSAAFPNLTRWHPLRVYAALEVGIGVCGIAVLHFVPWASGYYAEWGGPSWLRGGLAAVCLAPPSFLMGATLPALARCGRAAIYPANLAGAVAGCFLAGFYLLPQWDMAVATYFAALINFASAGCAGVASVFVIAGHREEKIAPPTDRAVLIALALSGFCALACEAIWTRTLGLLFGASAYGLSLILAVFLIGLGLGSAASRLVDARDARRALGVCQLLACVAMAWAAHTMTRSLPYWPVDPAMASSVWFSFELDFVRAMWVMLPAALLWGASFSLALVGQPMPRVYAWNTLGALVGALGASLWMIAPLGSQTSERVVIAVSAVAAVMLLQRRDVIVAVVVAVAAITVIPPFSPLLAAHGRYAASWVNKGEIVYAAEGKNSTVAVTKFADEVTTFHVAGKIQASTAPRDLRLQRMMGHLTTLPVARPRSVLVIGCGAGVTAGAVAIDPRVERVTIAEIEPLVPRAAREYFGAANFNVLQDAKVVVRIDDGRHFLQTSREKFDGITIDPLDPWVSGAANLYTLEFLESAKRHLNPGGVMTVYVQLFETTPEAVKSTLATFFYVFPNATAWGNPFDGRGHDMVLLGSVEPLRIDLDEMERRADYRGESVVSQSLTEIGMNSPVDLFATYAGSRDSLAMWFDYAVLNRDSNLRMQYLAGLGLDRDDSAEIYAQIIRARKFPEGMFRSEEGRLDSLRRALAANPLQ